MKALAIILAIIGGLCLFKVLPASAGGAIALLLCVVSVLVLYFIFRFLFGLFKRAKKKLDHYCDDEDI